MALQNTVLQQRALPGSCTQRQTLQAPLRCQRSQPRVAERAVVVCAAEAQASEERTQGVDVASLKTGIARYNGIRGSATKFRRVIDQIRGRTYADALYNLTTMQFKAVDAITFALKSAAANAANNEGADKNDLVVSRAFVDEGGYQKKLGVGYKGRPYPIKAKKSHITIEVTELNKSQREALRNTMQKKRK